jgi:hypothetical protein
MTMRKTIPALVAVLVAGVVAGTGFGSAPGPARHSLRIGSLRASFPLVVCKPKTAKKCKPPAKPVVPKTKTVTHTVTVTNTTTETQTVTATQTVTVAAPPPAPAIQRGTYAGLTQNSGPVNFVVGGSGAAYVVQQISISEVDATCTLSSTHAVGHLTIYDVSFTDTPSLDAGGGFSVAGTATWSNGDSLTVAFSGVVATNGTAHGTLTSTGNLGAGGGDHWACTSSATWTAAIGG